MTKEKKKERINKSISKEKETQINSENIDEIQQKEKIKETNGANLSRGKQFESMISRQCAIYIKHELAVIDKIPEPFQVKKRAKDGGFEGRFTSKKARPDFQGTLHTGKSIVIEAKSTSRDRIEQCVITDTQTKMLDLHESMGAVCLIACQIGEKNFCIPWKIWKEMKSIFGRKYVKADDLSKAGLEIIPQRTKYPFLDILGAEYKTVIIKRNKSKK